jgi:hypothetical protein
MQKTSIKTTRNKLATFYGVGILVFAAIVAFITALVLFLQRLNLT